MTVLERVRAVIAGQTGTAAPAPCERHPLYADGVLYGHVGHVTYRDPWRTAELHVLDPARHRVVVAASQIDREIVRGKVPDNDGDHALTVLCARRGLSLDEIEGVWNITWEMDYWGRRRSLDVVWFERRRVHWR
ncbi:MAG: hypothetical protein ACRDPK_18910 [Carbonactinosporaceae bacterium]